MTAASPVLAALRQATAESHRRIEGVASLPTLGSLEGLARALTAFSAFHDAWEPAAQAALPPADAAWLRARSRHAWLQQDLRALAAAGAPLPPPAALPVALQLPDAAAAWGSVYVMEGSTLGGQLIARHLREALGLTPDTGARYHAGHGPRTAALWRDCCDRLQAALGADAAACQRACDAAVHTFDALAAVMQQLLHGQPAGPARPGEPASPPAAAAGPAAHFARQLGPAHPALLHPADPARDPARAA